jgi:hypothetical protein
VTVIYLNEIGRGRRRGEIGTSYVSGYSRFFTATTNTPFDGADEVIAGSYFLGLPPRGAPYTQPQTGFVDAAALCIKIAASQQQEDDEQKWTIECQYSSEYQPPIENFNPNADSPLFRWGSEKIAQGMQTDLNGIPVVNSAGDPFETQSDEYVVKTLTMTRNEPFYNLDLAEYLENSVNYYPIWGYGRGQAWLIEYSAVGPQFRNGIQYWPHTYVWKLDRRFVGSAGATGGITSSLTTMPQQIGETSLTAGPAPGAAPQGGQLVNEIALPIAAPPASGASGDASVGFGNSPVTSFEVLQLLDKGKRELDPNNPGKLRPILAGTSQVSEAVMLDGNGHARPLGPAVYLFFTRRWALDWTALNLPAVVTGN